MRAALALLALMSCGPSWTAADERAATNAVLTERAALHLCAPSDAGECRPSQVRALEQASLCANASMLARHGVPLPADASDGCRP